VEDSKSKSIEAQNLIPQIEDLVAEAEQKTQYNMRSLDGAKEAASRAFKDAEEAKSIADRASQVKLGVKMQNDLNKKLCFS